jgi:hypothetical protein
VRQLWPQPQQEKMLSPVEYAVEVQKAIQMLEGLQRQPSVKQDADLRVAIAETKERLTGALNALKIHNEKLIDYGRELGAIQERLRYLEDAVKKKGDQL